MSALRRVLGFVAAGSVAWLLWLARPAMWAELVTAGLIGAGLAAVVHCIRWEVKPWRP